MDRMTTDRDFYETAYHFDDDVANPGEKRLWRAMRYLEPMSGGVFLDLGSGVGWAAQLASERGGARLTVGVDFALRALQLGQTAIPGISRIQGDGTALPFRNASFERVLSFGSLEHFPDVVAGVRELARVLKPGGRAVVVVPNFYVRTEQPRELRLSYGRWRRVFDSGGLQVIRTGADRGPDVMRDRRPLRIAARAAAKVLSIVPRLPYQFIFVLAHRDSPVR